MKTQLIIILLISAVVLALCAPSSGLRLRPYRYPATVRPLRIRYYPIRRVIIAKQPRYPFYMTTKTSVPTPAPRVVLSRTPELMPTSAPTQAPELTLTSALTQVPELPLTSLASTRISDIASTSAPTQAPELTSTLAPTQAPPELTSIPAQSTQLPEVSLTSAPTQAPTVPPTPEPALAPTPGPVAAPLSSNSEQEAPVGSGGQLMPVASGFVFEENMEPEPRSSSFM